MYIYVHVHIYAFTYKYIYKRERGGRMLELCMCVCMYLCMYVGICMYVFIHSFVQSLSFSLSLKGTHTHTHAHPYLCRASDLTETEKAQERAGGEGKKNPYHVSARGRLPGDRLRGSICGLRAALMTSANNSVKRLRGEGLALSASRSRTPHVASRRNSP